jgi:O-antigen/teichoic acid export membrane protein
VSRRRTAGVLLAGQVAYRGAVAAYTLLLVHRLGRAEYGDVSYLLAIAAMLTVVADGGFSRLLVRDVARSAEGDHAIVRPILVLRAAWVGVVAVVFALVCLVAGLPGPGWAIAALVAIVAFEASAFGLESAGVGAELPWRVAAPQLAGAAVLLAASGAFLAGLDASIGRALAAFGLASATKLAGQLLLWRTALGTGGEGWDRERAWRWTRQAFPFLLLALLGTLYYRIDMVILHARQGAAETASYGAAYRVVDALLVLAGVAAASVSAHLSRLHAERPEEVLATWRRYAVQTMLALAVPLLLLGLFAYDVSEVAFGERYRRTAGEDLRLLVPGMLFMTLQVLNAAVLFTSDLQRRLVTMSLVQVALNVGLTYWLVGRSGSEGAALATTLSEAFTFCYFSAFLWLRFRR